MARELAGAVDRVVRNGNCSGCGGCALISSRVSMDLSAEGYMRPSVSDTARVDPSADRAELELFNATCPGVRLKAPDPQPATKFHPTFGSYISAWEGWALAPEVRHAGSSAGVLTALAGWIVESGQASVVTGSTSSSSEPSRTVPVRLSTKEEALAAAGSRYAPVANLIGFDPKDSGNALVGKPCEVSAAAQLHAARGGHPEGRPLMLSFFCAGTPSQRATDELAASVGVPASEANSLRYRGNGWPGDFVVTAIDGRVGRASYDDSWGKHLGRNLQWRCKICVDGTGGHADIAVGDFWKSDAQGYPVFTAAEGVSAILVRTIRGQRLLDDAVAAGVVFARPIEIDEAAAVQPLQNERKRSLVGRLIGRIAAGKRVPRYSGYRLLAIGLKYPELNLRGVIGTFRRSFGDAGKS